MATASDQIRSYSSHRGRAATHHTKEAERAERSIKENPRPGDSGAAVCGCRCSVRATLDEKVRAAHQQNCTDSLLSRVTGPSSQPAPGLRVHAAGADSVEA